MVGRSKANRGSWGNDNVSRRYEAAFLLVCTGVHCQQQSFRVRPQPVEVIEGRTVELRCEVANQAGAVQWSKDGFVLGESRRTLCQSHGVM
ncbi:hypothetical protein HPB52_012911 [Rhipicephalus sanguineus]|uniref:Ig-like domain-containing protein n=1 Tax=Rhipicephalus sanguineus TaxID=34632 RepID=A0A9D4PPQ9_RHISA|nr:hypothetical protein HPB52_012911 [Rhipicephalus sanguineus]